MQYILLKRFLIALTLVGLLLAPLSQTVAMSSMSPHMAMASADRMDCCPSGQSKAEGSAKVCPFRSVCMTVWSGLLASEAIGFDFRELAGYRLQKVGPFQPAWPERDTPSPPPRA